MTPKFVHQPTNSKLCGQCCVAMVAHKTLEEVIKIIGHERGTSTKELARALRKLGFSCPDRLRWRKTPPPLAIAKQPHNYRRGWHWIVICDGVWYDPLGISGNRRKLSSYLPLEKI